MHSGLPGRIRGGDGVREEVQEEPEESEESEGGESEDGESEGLLGWWATWWATKPASG